MSLISGLRRRVEIRRRRRTGSNLEADRIFSPDSDVRRRNGRLQNETKLRREQEERHGQRFAEFLFSVYFPNSCNLITVACYDIS